MSGGYLALDFANTVGGTRTAPTEHLGGYQELLEWARQAGVMDEAEVRRLARSAERRPAEAKKAFRRGIELREAIFRAFDARARARPEPLDSVDVIDREAREAAQHHTIRRRDGGFVREWENKREDLERPLWPVAVAAADLLMSRDERIVKECGSNTCDWLFIDRSRNRSRRWCDMRDCGNREKARRFYARKRARSSAR